MVANGKLHSLQKRLSCLAALLPLRCPLPHCVFFFGVFRSLVLRLILPLAFVPVVDIPD